jgi:hypothetical protein
MGLPAAQSANLCGDFGFSAKGRDQLGGKTAIEFASLGPARRPKHDINLHTLPIFVLLASTAHRAACMSYPPNVEQ